MARNSDDVEIEVNHPAAHVWSVHVKNFQMNVPAAMPGHYSRVEFLDGPPLAAGGVVKLCYDEQFGHYEHLTMKWTEMDHENHSLRAELLDGGFLGKHFSHIAYNYKLLPGPNENSCIISWKFEFEDIGDHDNHSILKDELVKIAKCMEAYAETQKK